MGRKDSPTITARFGGGSVSTKIFALSAIVTIVVFLVVSCVKKPLDAPRSYTHYQQGSTAIYIHHVDDSYHDKRDYKYQRRLAKNYYGQKRLRKTLLKKRQVERKKINSRAYRKRR